MITVTDMLYIVSVKNIVDICRYLTISFLINFLWWNLRERFNLDFHFNVLLLSCEEQRLLLFWLLMTI